VNAPAHIGEYAIERELSAGSTYLASAPGGRRVVLKRLDNDCLLGRQLHPLIKDRLGRVRELAHLGVANLLTIERADQGEFLVWEFVPGMTLGEFLKQRTENGTELRAMARELALHVESLHALGIVHGALHERNIIVAPDGALRLTHISPLLYEDTAVDIAALSEMLEEMGLAEVIEDAEGPLVLRELIARLSGSPDDPEHRRTPIRPADPREKNIRRAAIAGAVLATVLGAALAWGLWRWARGHAPQQSGAVGWIGSGNTFQLSRTLPAKPSPHPSPGVPGEGVIG
jgi:hypothetical protein